MSVQHRLRQLPLAARPVSQTNTRQAVVRAGVQQQRGCGRPGDFPRRRWRALDGVSRLAERAGGLPARRPADSALLPPARARGNCGPVAIMMLKGLHSPASPHFSSRLDHAGLAGCAVAFRRSATAVSGVRAQRAIVATEILAPARRYHESLEPAEPGALMDMGRIGDVFSGSA